MKAGRRSQRGDTQGGLILCMLLVWVSGCQSSPVTRFDIDPATDFSEFHSFSWIEEPTLRFHSMDLEVVLELVPTLESLAREKFQEQGLRYVEDPAQADLLMGFTIGSRERLEQQGYRPSAISGDWNDHTYWQKNSRVLGTFVENQLCIDLFDRASGKPIWHGTARGILRQAQESYWQEGIEETVTLIAAGYPGAIDNRR